MNLPEFLEVVGSKAPDAVKESVEKAVNQVADGILNVTTTLCPVDTGALRASISVEVTGGDTIVATADKDYASYVDEGTRFMAAEPFFQKPIEGIKEGLNEVIERTLAETGLFVG